MDTKVWKQNWVSVLKVEDWTKKTEPVRSSKTAVHLPQATRRHTKSGTINTDRSVKAAAHSNPLRWNKQTNKQTNKHIPFDVQHSADARPHTCSSISPNCKIRRCWRWVWASCTAFAGRNSFYFFYRQIENGMKEKRNWNTLACRCCSPQNGAEMRPLQ